MDVILITSGSTNTTNDTTNKTTPQAVQHILIPQITGLTDASSEGNGSTSTPSSTEKHSSDPSRSSEIGPSLTSLKHEPHPTNSVLIEYPAQIPYNPNRPPPYTYQRQHEFPPFPPLTRHPVLPFLTTAFTDQDHLAASQSTKQRVPVTARPSTGQRSVQNHISTIPTMDVSKNDPTAIFIHPPFVVPPLSEREEAGPVSESEPAPGTPITYAILHTHRNWFLDADDFGKDNPHRIDYPPELEPPRGWAPLNECLGSGALKKQKEKLSSGLRTKGSYVTPEPAGVVEYGPSDDCHELTVLRCTFCRREYHGPNAKSMWRRHVYDKHKVAMKNRREGSAGSAIRNMLKKPKGKGPSDLCDMTSPTDASQGPLDLNNEQNIIRLLERVVSGDLQLCLPASIPGGNTVDLQTIANALHRSGITISLNNNNLEVVSSSQPGRASNQSVDSREVRAVKDGLTSAYASIDEPSENPKEVVSKQDREDGEGTEQPEPPVPKERTPLKDNTFADRNHHNTAITPPGTPRKDKTKQRNLLKSPPARPTRNNVITPFVSPSRTASPYHHHYRSLTSTALRARALATTGHESYLTLLASSPSTTANSPMKSLSHNVSPNLNRSSPFFKIKPRDSGNTSDDLGILGISSPRFSFDLHMEPSDYMPTFDPVEVSSKVLTPLTATLAPPAQVDEQPSRSVSTSRASTGKEANTEDTLDELKLQYPESSPSQHVQRRRSNKNEDRHHEEDFDMDRFIDLKDSGTNSSVPSSPQKISPSREFAKEFGLLSQEEVERITGGLQPGFHEEFRSSKRRRIGSPI